MSNITILNTTPVEVVVLLYNENGRSITSSSFLPLLSKPRQPETLFGPPPKSYPSTAARAEVVEPAVFTIATALVGRMLRLFSYSSIFTCGFSPLARNDSVPRGRKRLEAILFGAA